MKIYGFYHVWGINNYKDLVYKQLKNIIDSELLNKTSKLYIGFIGTEENFNELNNIVNQFLIKNVELFNFGEDITQYEFPTLDLIDKLADSEEFYCYYLHTKGVSYFIPSENLKLIQDYKINQEHVNMLLREYNWLKNKYPEDFIISENLDYMYNICMQTNQNIETWRVYMEYFIINKHDICIQKLNDGYFAVGTHTAGSNRWKHFRGNFWWSKSSHIRNLKNISEIRNYQTHQRRQAELWIGMYGNYPNFYCFHYPKLSKPIWIEKISDDYKNESKWNTHNDLLENFYKKLS